MATWTKRIWFYPAIFMRTLLVLILGVLTIAGCGNAVKNPLSVDNSPKLSSETLDRALSDSHYLWGEWEFYIDESHENIDVVPRRNSRFHLNALKFLEEYCADCLKITNVVNNGDGTIDLSIRLSHPFKGFPQYTGFDVKGIIMFEGSYEMPNDYPTVPIPDPVRISWRKLGDPELINPDGYSHRWYPGYESGSELPIFNYWEGKHAKGTPSAHLNAYRNFYSIEERHIFETDASVARTYKIWLPPGEPVTVGYAVDASWEPPTTIPVSDPVTDFPISANQPEYYEFEVVVNEGQTITDCTQCCVGVKCETMYVNTVNWGEQLNPVFILYFHKGGQIVTSGPCPPPSVNSYSVAGFDACIFENGWYRGYAVKKPSPPWEEDDSVWAFTVFDDILDY